MFEFPHPNKNTKYGEILENFHESIYRFIRT